MAICRECGASFDVPVKKGSRPQFCSGDCRSSHRKKYYQLWFGANRERVLSEMRKRITLWREENKDYWKQHYAANSEKKKASRREWFRDNRERALAKAREYAAANPDLIRTIGRKNRQTRRARLKSVFVEAVDARVVFERDKGMCGICMKPVGSDKWHVDHITPIARGGEHSYANSQLAHAKCNQSKGARV